MAVGVKAEARIDLEDGRVLKIEGHTPPNAGGEFRRDSDVNSTALLADSGGDK